MRQNEWENEKENGKVLERNGEGMVEHWKLMKNALCKLNLKSISKSIQKVMVWDPTLTTAFSAMLKIDNSRWNFSDKS